MINGKWNKRSLSKFMHEYITKIKIFRESWPCDFEMITISVLLELYHRVKVKSQIRFPQQLEKIFKSCNRYEIYKSLEWQRILKYMSRAHVKSNTARIEKQGNSTYVVIQEVEVLPLKLSQVLFIIQSHFKSDKSLEMGE